MFSFKRQLSEASHKTTLFVRTTRFSIACRITGHYALPWSNSIKLPNSYPPAKYHPPFCARQVSPRCLNPSGFPAKLRQQSPSLKLYRVISTVVQSRGTQHSRHSHPKGKIRNAYRNASFRHSFPHYHTFSPTPCFELEFTCNTSCGSVKYINITFYSGFVINLFSMQDRLAFINI
jgi:hypothetical protein